MREHYTPEDEAWMREAIALAARGEGRVSPNPPVGCVLVKDGEIIARGWHDRLGDLHAEAMALREAGGASVGATAYVTLSPCTSHGRQPPCTDALIRAKIARVVVAAPDPNPSNANGVDLLRQAGIPASAGLLRDEAEYTARGFFKLMRTGLPFLTLKYAMTLDGKIAAATGDSRWVSGEESRKLVGDMRSRHDAILVGSGTALADDPLLTLRDPALAARGGPSIHPQPMRVVATTGCTLSPDAAMLREPGGKVVVACLPEADPGRVARLEAAGAVILPVAGRDGRLRLTALMESLGREGVAMVLCEGGGELAAGLLREGLVDEIAAFIAPKIIGGAAASGPVAGDGIARMADAIPVRVRECRRVGDDIFIRGAPS